MIAWHRSGILLVLAGVACGSSSGGANAPSDTGGALDCAWAAGDNCWKTALAPVVGCVPPSGTQGTLSADGKTCDYASGATIAFDTPFVLNAATIPSFTLTSAGARCLRYDETANGFTVTTSAGAVSITLDQSTESAVLTCPSGGVYSGSVTALESCQNGVPGLGEGSSGGTISDGGVRGHESLSLEGVAGSTATVVFDCATP